MEKKISGKQPYLSGGFAEDSTEIEEIADYWKYRSESYSELNIEEMHSWKKDAWRDMILRYGPKKSLMKVLDVGTGPGFFAIILALAGNDVYGIDVTPEMLEHARANARSAGVQNIHFCHHRGEKLDFPDETFDIVVNRNVTWNLEYPEKALGEWKRVLKPGGRVVYFDADWYRYLYDEAAAASAEEDSRNLRERYPEYAAKVQTKYLFQQEWMEDIVRTLPLSNVGRPEWDRRMMENLGMKDITILPDINSIVYDEMEQVRYHSTPMFMVAAEKPDRV